MGLTNANYWMPEYIDDFGNKYPNMKFKISKTAPRFEYLAGVGFLNGNLYTLRSGVVSCSQTSLFNPRHLVVTFNSGQKIQFPVPRTDVIKDMVQILKPSVFDNTIPGNGDDEAACIDLIGEKWNYVPAGILGMKPSDFRKDPLNSSDFDGPKGKTSYNYDYYSDLDGVGKINVSFSIHNDNDFLHGCQREGMTDWKKKTKSVCSAASIGVSARHFIIKSLVTGDTNSILPGGKEEFTIARQAPVSGIDANILPGSDQAKTVAKDIAKCAQCLGWQGESITRVDLLVGSNLI
jgi:hypothetical protein